MPDATRPRWYDDACGAAHALDLVGERWSLLVMRELMLGPKRFGEIRASLPGISANVLTQRLEGLEAAGIVVRRKLPPPAGVQVYDLTEWGAESEPILQALGRWAARSPAHDPTLPFSAASFLLSLRTMFAPDRAKGLTATVGFAIGEDRFRVEISKGRIAAGRGTLEGADVVFRAEPPILAAAIYGDQPLAALEDAGVLQVDGDRAVATRFVTLFPLPAKASRPASVRDGSG